MVKITRKFPMYFWALPDNPENEEIREQILFEWRGLLIKSDDRYYHFIPNPFLDQTCRLSHGLETVFD